MFSRNKRSCSMQIGGVPSAYASNGLRGSKTFFREHFFYKTIKLNRVLSLMYLLRSSARYGEKTGRLSPLLLTFCAHPPRHGPPHFFYEFQAAGGWAMTRDITVVFLLANKYL